MTNRVNLAAAINEAIKAASDCSTHDVLEVLTILTVDAAINDGMDCGPLQQLVHETYHTVAGSVPMSTDGTTH